MRDVDEMPNTVVFDCESDGLPARTDNNELAFRHVQCTVACAIILTGSCGVDTIENARRIVAWRDATPADCVGGPFADLLLAFDAADVIVGYNALAFDFPLLQKYYGTSGKGNERYLSHRLKTLDPFARIRAATGQWPKLDSLLACNGLPQKTASGAQAIKWWLESERALLSEYCMADVVCTTHLVLMPSLYMPSKPLDMPHTTSKFKLPEMLYSLRAALPRP